MKASLYEGKIRCIKRAIIAIAITVLVLNQYTSIDGGYVAVLKSCICAKFCRDYQNLVWTFIFFGRSKRIPFLDIVDWFISTFRESCLIRYLQNSYLVLRIESDFCASMGFWLRSFLYCSISKTILYWNNRNWSQYARKKMRCNSIQKISYSSI